MSAICCPPEAPCPQHRKPAAAIRLEAREHADGNIRLCRIIGEHDDGRVINTLWIPRAEWDAFLATLAEQAKAGAA